MDKMYSNAEQYQEREGIISISRSYKKLNLLREKVYDIITIYQLLGIWIVRLGLTNKRLIIYLLKINVAN